jgi:hypothetical protein
MPARSGPGSNIVAAWEAGDPEPARHTDWVRGFWSALRPYGRGVYVNFLSDEPAASVRAAYGDDKHQRLVLLKRRYDPDNFSAATTTSRRAEGAGHGRPVPRCARSTARRGPARP